MTVYTIHPIALKLWEIVQYTAVKVFVVFVSKVGLGGYDILFAYCVIEAKSKMQQNLNLSYTNLIET